MNADTCATLAGVFSVLLLVVPLEGRSLRAQIRRKLSFAILPSAVLVSSVGGIVLSVYGVNGGGLGDEFFRYSWIAFWIDLAATAFFLFLLVQQDSDDAAAAHSQTGHQTTQTGDVTSGQPTGN
jgi:hypothetical protein